jgi:putative membrane protein
MSDVAWRSLRAASTAIVQRHLDLRVEGRAHVPECGPAILAARHYHHLYDGCAILSAIPRPVHILVALDWVENPAGGIAMRAACRGARWPVVLRPRSETRVSAREAASAFRRAARDAATLLDEGRILLVFPEGYPTVDPRFTPKTNPDDVLPFQRGVVRLASIAAAHCGPVPVIPVGLVYEPGSRWRVTLRFGEPLTVKNRSPEGSLLADLERRVRLLSGLPEAE